MSLSLRRQSRELALQVLFQLEFAPQVGYQAILDLYEKSIDPTVIDYADHLVVGINAKRTEIDSDIQKSSSHWKLDRMATVDRNVLRIAAFEMKFSSEKIEPKVAINEAIEIAKKYGTTDSASFVNGLLDQLAKGH